MLGVGQGGLAGTGEAEDRRHVLAAVVQGVLFLAAVAGGVAIAVGDGPGQGQGALLVLAEIAHTQDGGAVGVRVEVAQALGIADVLPSRCAGPLGIGEDIDVGLGAAAHGIGLLVHLDVLVGLILEVQHPVIEEVLLPLGNEQVRLDHELGVQADEDLGVVHGLPAAVIDGVHDDFIQFRSVHAGLSGDAAGGGIAAGDGSVIEQQNLGVGLQTELLAPVDGHVGDHGAGGVLGHVIGFAEGVDLHDIVAVEGSLDDGAGLGEPNFAGPNLSSGVIGFRRHICSSFKISKRLRGRASGWLRVPC